MSSQSGVRNKTRKETKTKDLYVLSKEQSIVIPNFNSAEKFANMTTTTYC